MPRTESRPSAGKLSTAPPPAPGADLKRSGWEAAAAPGPAPGGPGEPAREGTIDVAPLPPPLVLSPPPRPRGPAPAPAPALALGGA
jgi:hypothetical protein